MNVHIPEGILNSPIVRQVTPKVAKVGLQLRKYSPQILTAVGIGCVIGGMIMACQETSTLDDVLNKHELKKQEFEAQLNDLKTLIDNGEVNVTEYTEADERKDRTILWVRKAFDIAKHYAPSVCMAGLGIVLIIGGQATALRRYTAISAAYLGLQKQFVDYRGRVKAAYGEEAESDIYYGNTVEKVKTVVIDEDGKQHNKTVKVKVPSDNSMSIYAKYFDEGSCHFSDSPDANYFFLAQTLARCNEILNRKGYLFLNEVYDMLDIPRTTEGQLVGWVKNEGPGGGDNFVDFGIYMNGDQAHRDFVNGYNKYVLLDFNVDGPIYDLI